MNHIELFRLFDCGTIPIIQNWDGPITKRRKRDFQSKWPKFFVFTKSIWSKIEIYNFSIIISEGVVKFPWREVLIKEKHFEKEVQKDTKLTELHSIQQRKSLTVSNQQC